MEVFEFGLALYEMSTGIELYRGRSPEEKEEALHSNGFPDLSQVKGLGGVISTAGTLSFAQLQIFYRVYRRYVIGHNPSSYTTNIATVRLKSLLVLYPRDNILIRPNYAD